MSLILSLSFLVAVAMAAATLRDPPLPIDQWCADVLERGGCAACEASEECSFCAPRDDTYDGYCIADSAPFNCEVHRQNFGFVTAKESALCPAPGEYQARIRKQTFDPSEPADVRNAVRYTTLNDEDFCSIGLQRPHDRMANKFYHKSSFEVNDDLCYVANHQFGIQLGQCTCCCEDEAFVETTYQLPYGRAPVRNYIELAKNVFNECYSADPPHESEETMECVRLMQIAYCSQGCHEFDRAQGLFCDDSEGMDELYRLCAPYTQGRGQPALPGCVLDPNNLLLANKEGAGVVPAHCDNNPRTIRESDRFQAAFRLEEGTFEVPYDDYEICEGCFTVCDAYCENRGEIVCLPD